MKPKKDTIFEKILLYIVVGVAIFAFGLLAYMIVTMIINGSFSLEFTAEKLVQEGEEYCGSYVISENKGVAFIGYNCTDGFRRDCTGRYALFLERTEEGWMPTEKKVIW